MAFIFFFFFLTNDYWFMIFIKRNFVYHYFGISMANE